MIIETHPVIDFHGPSQGCGERLRMLTLQNKATCVKALDAGGWAFQAAQLRRESGVPHTIIFRQTAPGALADDHPDLTLSPEAAADKLWGEIKKTMPRELLPYKDIIYIEPINEPGVVTDPDKQEQARWIGQFCVLIAQRMLDEGWNPALAGFNAGTPSPVQVRDYFVDLLRLFEANWDRCLWTLHEAKLGGWEPDLDFQTPGLQPFAPYLVNSSPRLFAVCDELGIRRPRTFISEFAWSHNDIPHAEQFRSEVQEVCRMDAEWPEVVGRVIYTTHAGGTMWGGLRNKLNGQSPWLTEYVTNTTLRVEEAAPAPLIDARPARAATIAAGADDALAAGFNASIDLVNRTHAPGTTYRVAWIFANSGRSAWDGTYRLTYSETPHPQAAAFHNLPLATKESFPIGDIGAAVPVRPGEHVTLTLDIRLPDAPGGYATNWQLQAPDGRRFGPVRWAAARVAGRYDYELLTFANSAADYNNLQPGRRFSATWTLRNSGDIAWPGETRLAFVDAHRPETEGRTLNTMGAPRLTTLRELSGLDRVAPGEEVALTLAFTAPQRPGQYAFNWQLQTTQGESFGGLRWMGVGVAGDPTALAPVPTPGRTQFGMNVNINGGHTLDVERLRGVSWARYVYWASRRQQTPEEAFTAHYGHVIHSYAAAGINSLLVLHQDTEWGNGPWDSGDWETYAELFARACARVARACAPFRDHVAYQIFNETDSGFGDDAPYHNPSAIGIPPAAYGLILQRVAPAIREVDPGATIVLGGLKTRPGNAVDYLKIVEESIGGELPVDAIAAHPYGRFVNHAPFNFGQIGRLSEAVSIFRRAFPDQPLWITEIGVPGHATVLGPEYYETIATYMDEVVRDVAENHTQDVPVLTWFAWSDVSENAGIVTADGRMKPRIAEAYQTMIALNRPPDVKEAFAPLRPYDGEFLAYGTTLDNHNAVPAGTAFTNEWTFRNIGTEVWDGDCRLVYAPDDADGLAAAMIEETEFSLAEIGAPMPVEPGAEVALSLALTAPEKFGRVYTSRWELRDPAGQRFGHLYTTITVVPALTAGTRARRPDMVFIADQTVPDGTRFIEGQAFDKQWLVRNVGSRHWGDAFRLVWVDGDRQMARGSVSHLVPPAAPGEEVVLSVPMVAPPTPSALPAVFQSTWRLQDDHGNYFGHPLWAQITSYPSSRLDSFSRFNDPSGWYSQKDPRWAGVPLGFGGQTVGSWGCLLTCMAMMLTAFGRPYTPLELNEALKGLAGEQGFSGSAVQFAAPPHLLAGLIVRSNFRSWSEPEIPHTYWQEGIHPLQRIDAALAAGDAILAQVDHKRNNAIIDQHWVILLQRTPAGDDYEILDPFVLPGQVAEQPLSLMALYGTPNPARTHEDNLRDTIKSALLYQLPGMAGG